MFLVTFNVTACLAGVSREDSVCVSKQYCHHPKLIKRELNDTQCLCCSGRDHEIMQKYIFHTQCVSLVTLISFFSLVILYSYFYDSETDFFTVPLLLSQCDLKSLWDKKRIVLISEESQVLES